jgi:hypothetical protein
LYVSEANLPERGTTEWAGVVAENVTATKAMAEAGVLVDSAPLYPVSAATTIRVDGEEALLTDGPYAELKEQLGGYYLLECADLDEALRWARSIPAARIGAVEVRPVMTVERGD